MTARKIRPWLEARSRRCYNARMNKPLKITRIGNSAGIVLPKDVLARLRVGPGDTLHLTEAPDGVRLTAHDPDFEADMAMAEEIMREDRNILRALAK
jgi:putative addiction module antidote